MVEDASGKSNRLNERRKTLLGGVIFDESGKKWECSVSNISETGALIRSKAALPEGSFAELKINKLNDLRRVEVIWAGDGKYGVRFVVKISKKDHAMAELFKLFQQARA